MYASEQPVTHFGSWTFGAAFLVFPEFYETIKGGKKHHYTYRNEQSSDLIPSIFIISDCSVYNAVVTVYNTTVLFCIEHSSFVLYRD